MPKILINAITIEDANLTPLLRRIKFWGSHDTKITILGNKFLKKRFSKQDLSNVNKFINISNPNRAVSKLGFALEALRRNITSVLKYLHLGKTHDVIFTISSVADLVIYPTFLKIFHPKIRWLTIFDNTVPKYQLREPFSRLIVWVSFLATLRLLQFADHIFTVTDELKSFLISQGIPKNKITVTGNGLEVNLIKKAKKLSNTKIDALYVGRIHPEKGIYDLLEVVKRAKSFIPDFKLYIAGKGDAQTELKFKSAIKKNNLSQNVKLLGFISGQRKFDLLKTTKTFLFLSHAESFGIALLEATAVGAPSIAYNLKTYRKIYNNNEVNFFDLGDYGQITKHVNSVISQTRPTKKPRTTLLRQFSWESIAQTEMKHFKST